MWCESVRTYEGGGGRQRVCFSQDGARCSEQTSSPPRLVWPATLGSAAADLHAGGGMGTTGGGGAAVVTNGDDDGGEGDGGIASAVDAVAKCSGHTKAIRCLAHAPAAPVFVSSAEDGVVRLWAQ